MPTYATNKKARFDYQILDTYEAGLVLTGDEVKSIRNGGMRLSGTFVTFRGEKAYLLGAHIPVYPKSFHKDSHEADRSRPLLLHKKQLKYLRGKADEAGLTIVPLSVYTKGPYIKLQVAIAKGKKEYDKRETIKKRDMNRSIRRGIE